MIRESAQYEADAALSQSLGNVLEPFQHELIMAAIGMMSVRDETRRTRPRPALWVAASIARGRIIQRSLRTLHPIDNASPQGIECSSLSQSHRGYPGSFNRIHEQSPSFSPTVCFSYWASLVFLGMLRLFDLTFCEYQSMEGIESIPVCQACQPVDQNRCLAITDVLP